jgi:hypothetical protein
MLEQEFTKERHLAWPVPEFQQDKTEWEKIFGKPVAWSLDRTIGTQTDPHLKFEEFLEKNLEPNLSLQELSVRVVQSALEVEFGPKVVFDLDYAKMIGVIASALRDIPEMREVLLSVANRILRRKLNLQKKTVH